MESRIFLKVSDLEKLTGTSKRNCQNIMRTLRDVLGKKKLNNNHYQEVTINEYCNYADLNVEDVCKKIRVQF